MDETNRAAVQRHLLRMMSFGSLTKANVRAALDACDDWADANAAEYNTALPQPFRGAASAADKALLLAYVCMRRAGVLDVRGE